MILGKKRRMLQIGVLAVIVFTMASCSNKTSKSKEQTTNVTENSQEEVVGQEVNDSQQESETTKTKITDLDGAALYGLDYSDIELGNTQGNDLNGGLMCERGEWIYYCDYNNDKYLCKMRLDESDQQVLVEESCLYINVMNDTIFYMNQDGSIKSCDLDGNNVTTLVDDSVQHYIVTSDRIYFATKQIECMDFDGGNRRTILSQEGNYDELSLCDKFLLYTDYTSDQAQICAVNIETGDVHVILNNAQQGRRYGEYLYYSVGTAENSTYPLRRYQLSTGEVEQISLGSYPNVQEEVMFSTDFSRIRIAKLNAWEQEAFYPQADQEAGTDLYIDRYFIVNQRLYLVCKDAGVTQDLQLYKISPETEKLVLFD